MSPRPFGRYVLVERLAAGGMAEIYKAVSGEGEFRKVCAIKRILPLLSADDEFVRMFREEAALTMRLSHANVVQVFDFGLVGSDYYLAMEYVRGPS
ncbi:MAG TPA: protein kinase, partial [bacterium]|nr:protein kinase [bacterium]